MAFASRRRTRTYSIIRDPLNGHHWQVRVRTAHPGQDAVYGDAGDACDTQQEAEQKLAEFRAYDHGYDEMMKWLVDQNASVFLAKQALAARIERLPEAPYNDGAAQAIREYIADKEARTCS